jgi:K+-sensing histidine kinase KdpD
MFGLGHLDLGPIVYGVIMFIGILVLWYKLIHFKWISLVASAAVFWLVFSLHGGTMAGGFSAMVAALLFDIFVFPPWKKT